MDSSLAPLPRTYAERSALGHPLFASPALRAWSVWMDSSLAPLPRTYAERSALGPPLFASPALRAWSVWMDSNHRPRAYQARALTT
jgi:hypothetical protein